jgi:diguanylate cyclase (GGDEF)-like protein
MAHKDAVNHGEKCGYRFLDLIGKTAHSSLYHALALQHGTRAVLKLLEPENMLPERMEGFRREYGLLRSLDIAGVVKPVALLNEPGCLMMVLENFDGKPLDNLLKQLKSDFPRCLRLCLQLARILSGLHAARLIHGDVRPVNLLLDSAEKLWLADLSRSIYRSTTSDTITPASVGDWAYAAPEQTGRLNRTPDSRSDFYSLGVMLYRMLTGQLPFHGNDALEWAHRHLAHVPLPPAELRPGIPPMASAIVMKLLAKMPEERYQSAHGLCHDLETCLKQWEARGAIAPFALASQDVPQQLQIPQTLVGREAETRQLRNCFDAMARSGRPALVLVSGPAGVGKSAVVQELRRSVGERGGYFISGKFDQYQRDTPYATVTQAFIELVQQILAESEARVAGFRRQIQDAIGVNARLIVDVLPQMELIIGPQPPVPELAPAEAQNRFHMAFEKLIGVFAQQAHPLTLFLDDLQWADAASLRLLRELIASSDKLFLLVVGAYRENEVDPSHPLTLMLNEMRQEDATIAELTVRPLTETALAAFIDAMLQSGQSVTAPVTRLVYEKTGGNPFFVIQFMTSLTEERLLTFDAAEGTWRWDLARISAKGYTDNVAELMVEKLGRLPTLAQSALQGLACLGSAAPAALLATLCNHSLADIEPALAAAVRAGLIVRTADTVNFLHDRVREAAYLSIPDASRAALHLQIGRLLMADKTQAQIEEAIFTIANQFNSGAAGITDASEKTLLRRLNFLAGKKARTAVAYHSARNYLNRAMALLPVDAWQGQYEDSFALALALSECEYLVGNFERAEQLADLILSNAQSPRDRARVYHLRMEVYQMAGRFDEAISTMAEAVRLFGVHFPVAEAEIEAAIAAELHEITASLQGRRILDIADAALLVDADVETVIALLTEALPAAYVSRPDYFALISARATRLSLRHGNSEDSCHAYSTYGMVLLARAGDISSAVEFSEMALQLNRKLKGRHRMGRLLLTHAIAFNPLKNPVASSLPMLEQALAVSLEVGDLLNASYVTLIYFWLMLQQGAPLDAALRTVRRHGAFASQSRNNPVYRVLRFQQQLVASLKGQTRGPASLDDDTFDERECFAALEKENFKFGLESSHLLKLISAFIYGDYTSALNSAQEAFKCSSKAGILILVDSVLHFYFALTVAALYSRVSETEQRRFAGLLAEELALHKRWGDHCPQNFLSSYALLSAEIARIEGRENDAGRLFEQAIRSARENRFIQNEAIAFELASAFYRSRGLDLVADICLREARACYARWGADGKLARLDAEYPQLRTHQATSGITEDCSAMPLDVLSVAKASQAISSRIVLDELADTLLRIVLENAGAQTGCLLLCGDSGIELAADASIDHGKVDVRLHDRRTTVAPSLPSSILNYVRRTREQVLLPDPAQAPPFSADAYFGRHRPKSVLCLPILRQDAVIGLLYLENRLVTNAFVPERVTVLKLLASQAAISLENAKLYATLLQENRERKQAEDQIRHMAHHDALTGLPNRVLLQDRMEQAIAYAHRNQSRVAILFIDLDYFKNINDSLGHQIGDVLLQLTATRLQECLNEGDSVARLGGDEFVLCLPLLDEGGAAAQVAQKALDVLAQPFQIEGHVLHVSASIGISLYPDDATDVKTLMRTADTAMYHAKEKGRANFQFFTEALNRAAQRRLEISTRLRHALAHREFVLHYQPQVNMESGTIFSAEALLRWQRPGTQPISCGAFIENAEESGLIVPIGEWALRQACKQLKIWHDAGHRDLKIAVNLSPRQLQETDFCFLVEDILKEAGIPPAALDLEITEGTLMPHDDRHLAMLTRLSEMGIQLSVDDFGTGYSSLAYLHRFPVHALKIDQSFVRAIGKDRNDVALITAIIAMAASLRRKVMAEGVETLQQAQFLRAHGCLAAQGFYYSEAVPADRMTEILSSNSRLITN